MIFIFATRPKSEARTRIRIITSVKTSDFGHIDFSSKAKSRSCKSKQASCAKPDPRMVRGSCDCLLVIEQLGLWTQKIQDNIDYCYVWRREETRRVHFARPRTQASEPVLTDASLAAKRRTEAFHVVFFSNKQKHPSPAR